MIDYWESAKAILVPGGAAERSLLHVHAGMALYMVLILCLRRRFLTTIAPLAVTVLVVIGELADLSTWWPHIPHWLWWDSGTDIVHTIVWPWLIWAVANRLAASRLDQSSAEAASASGIATGR